ncbi:MAG: hypothetical protein EBS81_09645 [Gammaproteobacteria bacterium]|nr:hypothetical protein [Gammaproteobacteria bacterium]
MHKMKILTLFVCTTLALPSQSVDAAISGKFSPPANRVLVFAGQDNASVGGTDAYRDGYVDNVMVPAGITHYIYFSSGWTNKFGRTFGDTSVAGLNEETEWAAGPMHLKAYLDSPTLNNCIIHVSISMEGKSEEKVADGSFDYLIDEFVHFVASHPEHPFFIRIGYEFDGVWNAYDPDNFKKAFRRIVTALRAAKLENFAIVFASSSSATPKQFLDYDPGTDFYDWVGYSWWGKPKDGAAALNFARKVQKPVFIAEATPRGFYFDKQSPDEIWNSWFVSFFNHINENKDVIRAISYINADWDSQDMWDGWGQTRIESSDVIRNRWKNRLGDPMFLNGADDPFSQIGFSPKPHTTKDSKQSPLYENSSLPIEKRVTDLLSRMTIAEKVAQLTGWWDPNEQRLRSEELVFKPSFYAKHCPHGIGALGPLHNLTIEEDAKQYAAIQQYFRRSTRLGIPAMLHDEAAHGLMKFEANSFPAPIALACSWNTDLVRRVYSQAAREARSRGIAHVLSPVIDVARDPRWGRMDETLGEDAFLAGRLGAAIVEGLQGSTNGTISSNHVAATLKHFAGYASTSGGRNRSPYANGRRHLLDHDIAPFQHVIQSTKPAAVMAAFNEVDGIPCHINSWLLTDILRKTIGFDGLIVGDYQGIDLVRRYQKIGNSDKEVAKMALNAGLQLELPNNFGFKHLPVLLHAGDVGLARIDAAVRAVLRLKFRLGLFEAAETLNVPLASSITNSPKASSLALEAARQSIVLLKNDSNTLPLNLQNLQKIAVIGPHAAVCRLGNYSGKPKKTVSLLDGLRKYLGGKVAVHYAEGCKIAHNDTGHSYDNWRYVNEIDYATPADNRPLIAEATTLAKHSDVVILALGESVLLAREAWGSNHTGDRATLDLTESQKLLADSVIATGTPVILVLNNGKPVTLGALATKVPAVVTLHYAGQESGTAAAEILFGETNPTGKLTVSWPLSVGQLPSHYSQQSSSLVFDYIDSPRAPLFPFGHGMSYTQYRYRNLKLSKGTISKDESVEVTFDVENVGQRSGTEIAQIYVSGFGFEIARPHLELKGFARVTVPPGEKRQLSIELIGKDLVFHDQNLRPSFPSGTYEVRVGGSSTNLTKPVFLKTKASTTSPARRIDRP